MEESEEIKELIDEINKRDLNFKDYQKMKIEELSTNMREIMQFQQKIIQRIEYFEAKGLEQDLTKYAKMVCRNTAEREILKIQDVYLKKIETEYLK